MSVGPAWGNSPTLPEAVCVPVSIQGLEVLAVIDPLAAARTHGQLASCRRGKGVREILRRCSRAQAQTALLTSGEPAQIPGHSTQAKQSLCQVRRQRMSGLSLAELPSLSGP